MGRQLLRCIAAPGETPDLPLDIRGTAFQARVWRALQKIPLGQTATYSEIAAAVGRPKAVRAVAGPAPPTRWPCSCRAIGSSARTAISAVIAGGSRASARSWKGSGPRPRAMRPPPEAVAERVAAVDWAAVAAALDERGWATAAGLLTGAECREIVALYAEEGAFRRRIVMQRHAYGSGEYQYFRYPLPPPVEALRRAVYPRLAPIANCWRERLRQEERFPPTLDAYLALCHAAGQTRPTPLVLKYAAGDYNRLHQDLYGALVFPLQLTILLSDPASGLHRRRVPPGRAAPTAAVARRGCAAR